METYFILFEKMRNLCTSQWKAPHSHTRGMQGINGGF